MLRRLDFSSYAIEQTSEYLLSLVIDGVSSEDLTSQVIFSWARFLLQSHKRQKIALVYLANDLIQKCLLQPRLNNFHKAFNQVLYLVLPELFTQLSQSEPDQSNQKEILSIFVTVLKVIEVWITHHVYDGLHELKQQLMVISCLSEKQIHQENSVVATKADVTTLNGLKTEDFIVYKQMSFADMEIDDGGKYLEVD